MVILDNLDLGYCYHYATSVYVVSHIVVMCVAYEYNIVFFRDNLAPEVIQDIQAHQEGRSVIC